MSKSVCFVICPIGEEGSPERRRADEVEKYLIRPALGDEYRIVRCDSLGHSGEITPAIKKRLFQDALVVADFTGVNPNVAYEVGLRHAVNLPCLQVAQDGTKLPFDVQSWKTIFYDLTDPARTERTVDALRQSSRKVIEDEGVPYAVSPIEMWEEIRALLDPSQPEENYGKTLERVFRIVRTGTRARPVVRFWGNSSHCDDDELERFKRIGRELGRICAVNSSPVSGTDLQEQTLEHWVLVGMNEAVKAGAPRGRVYLHFNVLDPYAKGAPALRLVEGVAAECDIVEVPYPVADADRLQALTNEAARERVAAHDARIGSIFQADAVVLLGSNKSAKHLIQLMSFFDRHHLRAAKPIAFIPIPWVGGMGRIAHREFRGTIDDPDFVAAVVR